MKIIYNAINVISHIKKEKLECKKYIAITCKDNVSYRTCWRNHISYVGVDHETGIVHSLKVTSANKHNVCMTAELLTGEEQVVYGDSGYLGAEKRTEAVTINKSGKRIHYKINRRPSQSKHNSNRSRAQIKRREHEKSSVRAKFEHVFAVVKQQLRFQKTRYRGLRKQTAKLNILFALANLILADRPCLAAWVGAHIRTFWETFRSLFTVGFSFFPLKVICAVLPKIYQYPFNILNFQNSRVCWTAVNLWHLIH